MKTTAPLLGLLLLTATSATVYGADTPATPATDPVAPAAAVAPAPPPAVEPAKAEAPVAVPAAVPAPAFSPLVHPEPAAEKPADPDVLQLPKMVVKQKPRPRLTPEIMVTRKAFGEDLAKQKFTPLDLALNKFTLPLFGTSNAERALEEHEREKKKQLQSDADNLVKALETVDPTEAKSLKEAATRP